MSTNGLFSKISEALKKYHKFDVEKSGLYRDKNRNFSDTKMNKTLKPSFVEDLPDLWNIAHDMRNILHDCTRDLEDVLNLCAEKDKRITELQKTVMDKDKRIEELQAQSIEKLSHVPDTKNKSSIKIPHKDQIKYKLVIEEQSGDKITGQKWSSVVKSNVEKSLQNFPVSNSYISRKGGPTMVFPSAEIRDKAADTLKSDYKITTQSEAPRKLSPKIKIVGVMPDVFQESDANIIQEVRFKNAKINDLISDDNDFKIVYKNKEDRLIVVKTTSKIRDALKMSHDKIFFGLQLLNVYDHVHAAQCFHCQEFGHYSGSDYCKLKDKHGVCFYCAGTDHVSSQCKNKKNSSKHRCANCIKEKRQHTHHKATDLLCPTVIRETIRVYSRTDGMDESSKNWYLQMIEKLKQKRTLA